MALSFDNPPLVELIAELRWNAPGMPAGKPADSGQGLMIQANSKLDEFFMRFGGEIYADGFQSVERLVPPNFPLLAFQPVCRFRKHDNPNPALYQVGPGVFTANATPPYKNWNEFAPVVRRGVAALLAARTEDKDEPFFSTSVRYIDAFGPSHTAGQDMASFFENTLGIRLALPVALSKHIAAGKAYKPFLQLQLPMENNMTMSVGIGEGFSGGENAIIMDTTVATTAQIPPELEAVIAALNAARGAIHEMFVGITEPIHSLMKPVAGD